jgi:hypothetical protein
MPMPRRSAARAGSATPAKSTAPPKRTSRADSLAPSDTGSTKRATRSNAPQDGVVTNPKLPEVQTQQSFAYGSQKTPYLPDKLVAREKMSLQEMAETIDSGIRQAEQHFEAQAAEAEANFGKAEQNDARADRVRRRSESRESSAQSSRQGSVDSQNTDVRTTRRTAAWASSVEDSSHLDDITEEDARNLRGTTPSDIEDDYTRKGSDGPSSFPSGNFDISYNQERGRFRPTQAVSSPVRDIGGTIRAMPGRVWLFSKQSLSSAGRTVADLRSRVPVLERAALSTFVLFLKTTAAILSTGLAWILLSALFCQFYTRFLCEYDSSSALHFNLQKFCGGCVSSFTTGSDSTQLEKLPPDISIMLGSLNKRISQVESRIDAKHSVLSTTLNSVLSQQHAMEATVSDLQRNRPNTPIQSPLIKKINYCSIGNGAVIDPYLTSPTKQKQFNWLQRRLIGAIGMHKYQSHPPSEALRAWEEVGDCWCAAAGQGYAQLVVMMREMVYPTEVVIEHAPSDTSPSPGTAPKDLEIWADFSHLSPEEFVDAGLDKLSHDAILPRSFARIGKMVYKAGEGVPSAQTFTLNINQDHKTYATQKIVFRAISNYGAEHTCFYRVRLHGAPLIPHPQIKVDGKPAL